LPPPGQRRGKPRITRIRKQNTQKGKGTPYPLPFLLLSLFVLFVLFVVLSLFSWEQAAAQLLTGDLLDAQAQGRHAHRQPSFLRQAANAVERLEHQLPQLLVDLLLAPQE